MTDDHIIDNGAPPEPRTGRATQLVPMLTPWFQKAFEEHGRGEMIMWELGIQALPGPPAPDAPPDAHGNQQPTWESMLMLYIDIPGATLDTRILRSFALMPHGWNQEKVEATVKQVVPELIEGRSRQLEDMQAQAQQAMANGDPAPRGGLILPRG